MDFFFLLNTLFTEWMSAKLTTLKFHLLYLSFNTVGIYTLGRIHAIPSKHLHTRMQKFIKTTCSLRNHFQTGILSYVGTGITRRRKALQVFWRGKRRRSTLAVMCFLASSGTASFLQLVQACALLTEGTKYWIWCGKSRGSAHRWEQRLLAVR